MAYKIYTTGNYFYIEDTTTNRIYSGLTSAVKVKNSTTTSTNFTIDGVDEFSPYKTLTISELQDANGTTYTRDSFLSFYETSTGALKGPIDVVIQDSTSAIIIVPFSKLIIETDLTASPALDDYIINVTSAASFAIGQLLTIYDVASNRVYFGHILAINTLAITLDSPIDFAFPIGAFVSVGDTNLAVNGSVTPQIFGVRNPTNEDIPLAIDVTRIIFAMLTGAGVDLSKFGDIAGGITKGIILRKHSTTTRRNVFNAKTNAELKNIMYDFDIQSASGNQQDGCTGRLTFGGQEKLGAVIRLEANQDLQLVIQDDLSGIDNFEMLAEGSEVVD